MKKIISLISVLAMLISMMTTVAFADADNKLEWVEVDKTATTVTLKLVLTTNQTVTSAGCTFSLADATANGVTSVTSTPITASTFNVNTSKNVLAWKLAQPAGVTGTIELGTATFTYGAATKSFKITLGTASRDKFTITDENKNPIVDSITTTAIGQEITVGSSDIPVESITLNKEVMELDLNGTTTETLIATVLPADATDPTVTWESDKPEIATVDGGKVTAVAEGVAKITATAGDKSASCVVTVVDSTPKPESESSQKKIKEVDGKTLFKIGTIFKNAPATKRISVHSKSANDTKESTKTIAELLNGVAKEGTIDVEITVGILTNLADDVFTFGLVD